MALWDGRFSGGPAEEMVLFSECMDIDLQMWREDIEGSKAHARMLADVGLIASEDRTRLIAGLEQVALELESGCLLYTSPSPRDKRQSRMPSSA